MARQKVGGRNRFVVTPKARQDLRSVLEYIAYDSVKHAKLVRAAIFETFQFAADFPAMGHVRREFLEPRVLFMSVTRYDKYMIAYLPDSKPIRVVRVLHGAFDFSRLGVE